MKCSTSYNCCHQPGRRVRATSLLLLISVVASAGADSGTWIPTRSTNDATTRKGFDYFYNLEYDKAIREFEAASKPIRATRSLSIICYRP